MVLDLKDGLKFIWPKRCYPKFSEKDSLGIVWPERCYPKFCPERWFKPSMSRKMIWNFVAWKVVLPSIVDLSDWCRLQSCWLLVDNFGSLSDDFTLFCYSVFGQLFLSINFRNKGQIGKGHWIGFVMVWQCIRVRLAWEWLEIPLRHQYKSNQEPKLNQCNTRFTGQDHITSHEAWQNLV